MHFLRSSEVPWPHRRARLFVGAGWAMSCESFASRRALPWIEAAARLEDISAAKISRIETAKVGVRPRDVEALLDVYGASRRTAAHKSHNPYP